MTSKPHAFNVTVGIKQPAGNQDATSFNPKDIVDAHANGKRQAGDGICTIETIGGRTQAQQNVGGTAHARQDGSDMCRCFARAGEKSAIIDFGKSPAASTAKQNTLDIIGFHWLIGEKKPGKARGLFFKIRACKNTDRAFGE